jgi:hypothetical protein
MRAAKAEERGGFAGRVIWCGNLENAETGQPDSEKCACGGRLIACRQRRGHPLKAGPRCEGVVHQGGGHFCDDSGQVARPAGSSKENGS